MPRVWTTIPNQNTMTENQNIEGTPVRRRQLALLIPLAAFLIMAGVFLYALQTGDPSRLPSALIGKSVPSFNLPGVDGLVEKGAQVPGFSTADLAAGKVSVVNVWASWCVPCHAEHPFLSKLGELGKVPLYGINYKDKAVDARRFLGKLGNPFRAVGADNSGRTGIDWGVYGVPETYVVDGSGKIVFKHVGPMDEKVIVNRLLPAIEKARSGTGVAGAS